MSELVNVLKGGAYNVNGQQYELPKDKTLLEVVFRSRGTGKASNSADNMASHVSKISLEADGEVLLDMTGKQLRQLATHKYGKAPEVKNSTNTSEVVVADFPIAFTKDNPKIDTIYGLDARKLKSLVLKWEWNSTKRGYITSNVIDIIVRQVDEPREKFSISNHYVTHAAGTSDIKEPNLPRGDRWLSGLYVIFDVLSGNYWEKLKFVLDSNITIYDSNLLETYQLNMMHKRLDSADETELQRLSDDLAVFMDFDELVYELDYDSLAYEIGRSASTKVDTFFEHMHDISKFAKKS